MNLNECDPYKLLKYIQDSSPTLCSSTFEGKISALRKHTKSLNEVRRSPKRESKLGSPEYEAEMLSTEPCTSLEVLAFLSFNDVVSNRLHKLCCLKLNMRDDVSSVGWITSC